MQNQHTKDVKRDYKAYLEWQMQKRKLEDSGGKDKIR